MLQKIKKILAQLSHSFAFWLIFLFIFAFGLRLLSLNIPFGITHDELDYVLNAKWLSLSGSDLTQTWRPWQLKPIITETLTAELTPVVYSWFMPFITFNLPGVRLISSLIGALLPLALVWWLLSLGVQKKTAILSGFVFALNPWGLNFSRQLYEAPLSLLFILIGLALLASIFQKEAHASQKKKIMVAIFAWLALAFGYFTYHGNKFLVLPLFLVQFYWLWHQKPTLSHPRQNLRQAKIASFIVLLGVIGLYTFTLCHRADLNGRSNEIIFLNQQPLVEAVDAERFASLDSRWNKLFSNKLVAGGQKLVSNFLVAFNPVYWFWDSAGAEGSPLFGLTGHGWFYAGEFFLLLLGVFALINQSAYKRQRWLIAGTAFAALIPALITATKLNLTFRASFLIPIFCFLIALGIEQTLNWTKKNWRYLAILILLIMYAASFIYWQWYSWQRYPFLILETAVFHERLVSSYLSRQDKPIVIAAEGNLPYALLRSYIFYYEGTQIDAEMIQKLTPEMNKIHQRKNLEWRNFVFSPDCEQAWQLFEQGYRLIIKAETINHCQFPLENYTQEILSSPIDSGTWYVAISPDNQLLCDRYTTSDYIYNRRASDYAVETLSDQDFCAKWVLKKAAAPTEN